MEGIGVWDVNLTRLSLASSINFWILHWVLFLLIEGTLAVDLMIKQNGIGIARCLRCKFN